MRESRRIAIVTGGGKRVGAVIAQALLDDGWAVIAHVHHDMDSVPDGAIKVVADLAENDCAVKIFTAADELGPVNLLVNNAARFSFDGFGSVDPDEFDAHLRVNARAPMLERTLNPRMRTLSVNSFTRAAPAAFSLPARPFTS